MKKLILPLSLVLTLLLLFIGGILLAENVAKNRSNVIAELNTPFNQLLREYFPTAKKSVEITSRQLVKHNADNYVANIFQIVDKEEKAIGYIYVVNTKGFKPSFKIGVACDINNREVLGYKELEYEETYLDKLTTIFKKQFNGADMTNKMFEFSTVSGVTLSSNAIIEAVKLAREQFYQDLNEALPIALSLVSFKQDFANLNKFKATFDKEGVQFLVTYHYDFDKTFAYESSSIPLNETDKVNCLTILSNSKLSYGAPRVFIKQITGNTILAVGSGYISAPRRIQGTFTIDNDLINSLTIVHQETYEEGYSYSGEDPFRNQLIQEKFINQQANPKSITDLDTKALATGATESLNGLREMFLYVLDYLKEVK